MERLRNTIEQPQTEISPEKELQKSKEIMEARVEILEQHKVLFFSCVESGTYAQEINSGEGIPEELKKKIRSEIGEEDSDWFRKALGWDNSKDQKRMQVVNAIEEKNKYPEMGDVSGIIVSGSPHMVREDAEWMRALQEYIKIAALKNIPILGVCFGHQIIAKTFGGKVERTPTREYGTVQVDLTNEGQKDYLFRDLPQKNLDVLMAHSDSVTKIPENIITSLAFNSHNVNQAIKIGDNVRGVQFHPELAKEIIQIVTLLESEAVKNEGLDVKQIVSNLKNTPEAKTVLRNFDKYFVFRYAQKIN